MLEVAHSNESGATLFKRWKLRLINNAKREADDVLHGGRANGRLKVRNYYPAETFSLVILHLIIRTHTKTEICFLCVNIFEDKPGFC